MQNRDEILMFTFLRNDNTNKKMRKKKKHRNKTACFAREKTTK